MFVGQQRVEVLKLLLPKWEPTLGSQARIEAKATKNHIKDVYELFRIYQSTGVNLNNRNKRHVGEMKAALPWEQYGDSKTDSNEKQCILCCENQKCVAVSKWCAYHVELFPTLLAESLYRRH